MGFIRSAVRASAGSTTSLATPERWIVDWFTGGDSTKSGVRVDSTTAMEWAPFFAGVRNLSEDVGALPLPLYERLDRGKRRATGHPLYELLHDAPNELMGAMTFRSTLQGHAVAWGGGAAFIESDLRGRITGLWPLRPDRLTREVIPGPNGKVEVRYRYEDHVNGIYSRLLDEEVLYIPGFGFDGVRGYSAIAKAREGIGLGIATEQHGAAFFGNGARPSGILTHPDAVSDTARKRIRADWHSLHRGLDKAQRIAILEEGVSYQSIGVPNDDAQFLETRKFQVDEAARWLRLPPHKLGSLERATFSNIEQQSLDYIVDSLRPWLVRWEQAISLRLLSAAERRRLFAEHLVDGMLRGDIQTRFAAYSTARQWGWMSANDVREKENENPIDGGDTYLVPLNMVPAGSSRELPRAASIDVRATEGRRRAGESFATLIEDMDRRIAEMERQEVSALVRKHLDDRGARSTSAFIAEVEALYEDKLRPRMLDRWLPLFATFANEIARSAADDIGYDGDADLTRWARAYVHSHIGYRVGSALGQLTAATEADAPAGAVTAQLDKWVQDRPAQTARWETTQVRNAAAREVWRSAGVQRMRWVASGDNCPACTDLDGQVVGVEQSFAQGGAQVGQIQAPRETFHPPLHAGCDCSIVPD